MGKIVPFPRAWCPPALPRLAPARPERPKRQRKARKLAAPAPAPRCKRTIDMFEEWLPAQMAREAARRVSMITVEDLKKCHLKTVLFADGAKGMAMQQRRCVEHPTLEVQDMRANGRAPWTRTFFVDGVECANLQAVADALNAREAAA